MNEYQRREWLRVSNSSDLADILQKSRKFILVFDSDFCSTIEMFTPNVVPLLKKCALFIAYGKLADIAAENLDELQLFDKDLIQGTFFPTMTEQDRLSLSAVANTWESEELIDVILVSSDDQFILDIQNP